MRVVVVLLIPLICGCATPGLKWTLTENTATVEPVAKESWMSKIFPPKLPSGEYSVEKNEHGVKASAKTSVDMKMVDLNMLKAGK